MLTTLRELLAAAETGGYALIAPDFPSLFVARILMEYSEETGTPLIMSYATIFKPMRDVRHYTHFVRILRDELESLGVPTALHLDHATTLEDIQEAVDCGFTSVMIDASTEPYGLNVERTCRTVEIARPAGVSVEAELGHVASGADYLQPGAADSLFTDPEQAERFVADTGIDALAVAIGTVHGLYRGQPRLDFDLLARLHARLPVPLVLHGSSGLDNANLRQAVKLGIRKINVYSDLVGSMLVETKAALEQQTANPLKVAAAQEQSVRQVIERYALPSGSIGASITTG